jgi:hypothetical protein
MLRQQVEKENNDDPYFCQSDFVAPKETGVADYMGVRDDRVMFTTGTEADINTWADVCGCVFRLRCVGQKARSQSR